MLPKEGSLCAEFSPLSADLFALSAELPLELWEHLNSLSRERPKIRATGSIAMLDCNLGDIQHKASNIQHKTDDIQHKAGGFLLIGSLSQNFVTKLGTNCRSAGVSHAS